MEIIAKTSVRVAPRKVRLVADAIRKLSLENALRTLSVVKKRGGVSLAKTLNSAIANATNNNNLKREDLTIKSIDVLDAPSYKRFHFSTRGRVHPYKRRGSQIRVVLEAKDTKNTKEEVKENGTKS